MSEFTSGLLFLNNNLDKFDKNVKELGLNWQAEGLNNKWLFILMEDEDFAPVPHEKIIELSKQFPILFFINAEDHKWGFRIYNEGLMVSTFFIPHGEINLAKSKLNKLDIDEFKVFKIGEEDLNNLKKLLLENEKVENTWQQVELFKQLLNLEEFSWIENFIVLDDEELLDD